MTTKKQRDLVAGMKWPPCELTPTKPTEEQEDRVAKKRTDKQRATATERTPRQFDRVAKDIFRLADEAVQLGGRMPAMTGSYDGAGAAAKILVSSRQGAGRT